MISNNGEEVGDSQRIRHLWRNNFGESIRNIHLIESEDTLVALVGANSILLVGCGNGEQIA